MARTLATRMIVVALVAALVAPTVGWSQNKVSTEKDSEMGPRQQIATIIFSGLAGAVLGLSTLSFYGRPQDKLSNIAIGFALGVIAGTAYTTYQVATKPYRMYDADLMPKPWENEQDARFAISAPVLEYQFSF